MAAHLQTSTYNHTECMLIFSKDILCKFSWFMILEIYALFSLDEAYLITNNRGIISKPCILPLWLAVSKTWIYEQAILSRHWEAPDSIQHLIPKACSKKKWNALLQLIRSKWLNPIYICKPKWFLNSPCKNWICDGVHLAWFNLQLCQ